MRTKEEIEILKSDALSGDAIAAYDLGCAYSLGDGVMKDLKQAFSWYEKSALLGSDEAAYKVAICYHNGCGIQKNIRKAVEWYEKSASLDNGISANALGFLYEKGFTPTGLDSLPGHYAGFLPVNKEEAFYWYEKGSQTEDVARFNLARCYESGIGTHKDLKKARFFYIFCKLNGFNVAAAKARVDEIDKVYCRLHDIRIGTLDYFKTNPFRLLGVWSNSSEKEIRANQSKISALLKVKTEITFPNDHLLLCNANDFIEYYNVSNFKSPYKEIHLKQWQDLSHDNPLWDESPLRNETNIRQALSDISEPKKKIVYSLFWFWKVTSIDDKCLKLVSEKKYDEAIGLWRQENNFSAYINRAVIYWSERKDSLAISNICHVIHNSILREDFLSTIVSPKYTITDKELSYIFWDALFNFPLTELTWQDIYKLVTNKDLKNIVTGEDFNYIKNKIFLLMKRSLDETLQIAEIQPKDDYSKCSDAYYKVVRTAPYQLLRIKRFLGADDYRYKCYCNDIATKLLDIAIYINNKDTTHWDAPGTALNFTQAAQNIAIDETLKDRCKENLAIFTNNKKVSTSKKILEVIEDTFRLLENENVTFKSVKSGEEKIALHIECLATENGADSDVYKKVSDGAAIRLSNVVISLYNRNRNVTTATEASHIIDKLLKYKVSSTTFENLKRNKAIINKNMMYSIQKGDYGSLTPFKASESLFKSKHIEQFSPAQTKSRRLHKLIFSLLGVLIIVLISCHFSTDNNWYYYLNSASWVLYVGIVFIIFAISTIVTMWGMEFQEDPYDTDFDWLDRFISGLHDFSNEICQMGASGGRTYSWPLAIPLQLLEICFIILSFPIRWIAQLVALIK